MRNEIIFEDIQKSRIILLYTFLILHCYHQWQN